MDDAHLTGCDGCEGAGASEFNESLVIGGRGRRSSGGMCTLPTGKISATR